MKYEPLREEVAQPFSSGRGFRLGAVFAFSISGTENYGDRRDSYSENNLLSVMIIDPLQLRCRA